VPVRARGLLFPFPPLIDMEELLRLRLPRRAPMPDLGLRREAFCISAVRSERWAKTCAASVLSDWRTTWSPSSRMMGSVSKGLYSREFGHLVPAPTTCVCVRERVCVCVCVCVCACVLYRRPLWRRG